MKNINSRSGTRGSTIVEFAVVFTLLFAMMLGIIDFARAVYAYHGVANAAREATRYASIRGHASCTTTPRTFPTSTCPLAGTNVSTFVSSQLTAAGIYNNVVAGAPANRGDLAVTTTWTGTQGDGVTSCLTATTNPTNQDPGCLVKVQVQYEFGFTLPYWVAYQSTSPPLLLMSSSSQVIISQ